MKWNERCITVIDECTPVCTHTDKKLLLFFSTSLDYFLIQKNIQLSYSVFNITLTIIIISSRIPANFLSIFFFIYISSVER